MSPPIDPDLVEICEVFFEESAEGLEIMEEGLLGLDLGAADLEIINNIFRAAHSIKGGAGTFGFTDISGFTHGVETLLDQMRDGEREVTDEAVQLLLESVDCIGVMLENLKDDNPDDPAQRDRLNIRINEMLANKQPSSSPTDTESADASEGDKPPEMESDTSRIWKIHFSPTRDILHSGTDPLALLGKLKKLGEMSVSIDSTAIPSFPDLDPEELYMTWDIDLTTTADSEAINAVFSSAVDHCDLDITCVSEGANSPDTPGDTPESSKPEQSKQAAAKKAAKNPAKKKKATTETSSIRVGIDKVDSLLNLVGELVITQSMLRRFGEVYDPSVLAELRDGLMQLERHTRELQESAMQIRMLPINSSFSRFPRLVRDLSNTLGKKIELVVSGEHTEVDKTVLEKLSDPLVHLVRNSLDHGIEMPDVRVANGKVETGTLRLSAAHEGGNVVIKVEDDGAGLNRERILQKAVEKGLVAEGENLSDERVDNLIFQPGFSTAEVVSDVSGRGVGMDVVRRNIVDLGGQIRVQSFPGKGTSLRISLPLTLAILDGQLVRVGDEVYVISVVSIVETMQVQPGQIKYVSGSGEVFLLRDTYIPVARAAETFGVAQSEDETAELLVIVETENIRFGVLVNELLEQQQIVIKSIEKNYKKVEGLTGATILGDGRVALILDVPGILNNLMNTYTLPDREPELVEAA
ncbi:hypothetical protein AB833_13580 [Chromatiales bacterium (ex Bugula neritina AB1)]|nr:hypothetical protein AB833_13580 [Chromatiales bacterium (ex Bugula neritina AB1)]